MSFANMKIGARMGLGFGLVLALTLVVAMLGLTSMSQIQEHLDDVAHDHMGKLKLVSTMRDAMQTGAIAVRNLVLLTDEADMAAETQRIVEQRKIYAETRDKLAEVVKSEAEKALFARIADAHARTEPLLDKAMDFAIGNPVAATEVLVNEARLAQTEWLDLLEAMAAFQEAGAALAVEEADAAYASALGFMLLASALALVLGGRMLAGHASADLANAAARAVAKIVAIVSDETQCRLRDVEAAIDVAPALGIRQRLDLDSEPIAQLRQAVQERRVVSLRYFGRNRGDQTVRQVEPLRLQYASGAWYLTAYCRLRRGERTFRLDRIEEIRLEAEPFRPRQSEKHQTDPGVDVVARFRGTAARWVNEQQHWSYVGETQTEDGPAFRYRPGSLDEIAPWLLGWGASAEVLAPPELRERMREEARGLYQMLT